jgi:hypothetical protein
LEDIIRYLRPTTKTTEDVRVPRTNQPTIFRVCPQTANKNECDTNVNNKLSTQCDDKSTKHLEPPSLDLVRDGLVLLDGVGRALLVVALVGELGVVLDVRDADLGVVAVEDAGDFLESGAPVKER